MTALNVFLSRPAEAAVAPEPAAPKFLDRLPPKLLGGEVPVSRTYARELRDKGWI
ncbi:MAG: hypothetical protein WCY15_16395 [Phenylobacterium sp.]|uniref:hypothetical protein n=1 Tax=Phenylobacterium sp. TaxID=1871053 RepID=UPI002A36D563|nr:hypothetical protein [Phenylobacterium sp.]MDX9997009.1 hypothetical protein [Phenylobacterium sp.]